MRLSQLVQPYYPTPADIDDKQDKLIAGTNIKTINGNSLLGSGDLTISGGGGRELLTADRTYYIRTDGSDSNDGLTNNSGGAFLTWAKAKSVLLQLDGNGYAVTVQGIGNFTENILIDGQFIGISSITLLGDTSTPSNCTLSASSGSCISIDCLSTKINIRGFYFNGTASNGIEIVSGEVYLNGVCDFGAIATHHVYIGGQKSQFYQRSNYTISGNSQVHIAVYDDSFFNGNGSGYTVTISGSRTFTDFVLFGRAGKGLWVNTTYTGSITGRQYAGSSPTFIQLVGTTLPGSTGVLSSGAYVL